MHRLEDLSAKSVVFSLVVQISTLSSMGCAVVDDSAQLIALPLPGYKVDWAIFTIGPVVPDKTKHLWTHSSERHRPQSDK
jgi:hypothetical protein